MEILEVTRKLLPENDDFPFGKMLDGSKSRVSPMRMPRPVGLVTTSTRGEVTDLQPPLDL
ncbi:hypothetical protein RUM43_005394 [Polyplax serrata]|uniref:Uncharacterized protein n=1 Tax=Polyplax serrata TaxID=468196 RepID=A0AAN8S1G0_POLSC